MCSLMQWVLNSLFFIMKWHKWNFLIGCQWCHIQVNAQVGLFLLLWTFSMTDSEFLESSCPSLEVNITLLEQLQLYLCNRIETCQHVFMSLHMGDTFLASTMFPYRYHPTVPTEAMWNLAIETSNNFLGHPFRDVFLGGFMDCIKINKKCGYAHIQLIVNRLHIICSSFISKTTKCA